MIILGLDISSSSSGWALLDNEKLVDYGLVKPEGAMSTTQRLYFFGNEIKKIIERCTPDEIAIEETILVRGPKIMRVLARFSGVALFQAYSYQKRDVKTYEPQVWKKRLGLQGLAIKPVVQLFICDKFDLLSSDKIEEYKNELKQVDIDKVDLRKGSKKELKQLENEILAFDKSAKEFKRMVKKKKKKEVNEEELKKIDEDVITLKEMKTNLSVKKKEVNAKIRDIDKRIEQVSMNVYSDCGINPDIADSIGVALTCLDETK